MTPCIACGSPATEWHHVVPLALLPNDGVVPLCVRCHGLVHDVRWLRSGRLISDALRHKKANGERVGAVDVGYRLAADGVRLEADAGEQATIARARELHNAGLSLRKVATALEGEGLTARNGKAFAATQIARMVAGNTAAKDGAP